MFPSLKHKGRSQAIIIGQLLVRTGQQKKKRVPEDVWFRTSHSPLFSLQLLREKHHAHNVSHLCYVLLQSNPAHWQTGSILWHRHICPKIWAVRCTSLFLGKEQGRQKVKRRKVSIQLPSSWDYQLNAVITHPVEWIVRAVISFCGFLCLYNVVPYPHFSF